MRPAPGRRNVSAMAQPIAPEVSRGRILVVDDDEFMTGVLDRLLQRSFRLALATRAAQALDWITSGDRFDVILCDLLMPQLSGMELHEQLLQRAPDQARRMIFMTGGASNTEVRRFLDHVSNPRLEKPFELKQLLVLINARLM
jgi:CheY-like chemotaxis protein